jgi:hypothetical protein
VAVWGVAAVTVATSVLVVVVTGSEVEVSGSTVSTSVVIVVAWSEVDGAGVSGVPVVVAVGVDVTLNSTGLVSDEGLVAAGDVVGSGEVIAEGVAEFDVVAEDVVNGWVDVVGVGPVIDLVVAGKAVDEVVLASGTVVTLMLESYQLILIEIVHICRRCSGSWIGNCNYLWLQDSQWKGGIHKSQVGE